MKFHNTSLVQVYYLGNQDKLFVGRLALKDRKIFFEYNSEFLKTGLELSPLKLPLKSTVFTSDGYLFEGLFGLLNDSSPDG